MTKDSIHKFIVGDTATIRKFYSKNFHIVRNFITRNNGDESDAEDTFQEAMIILYQRLKHQNVNFNISMNSYFIGICKNLWRNKLKQNKKIVYLDSDTSIEKHENDPEYLEIADVKKIYEQHFYNLSPKCQDLFKLYFSGLKAADIAKVKNKSPEIIRKQKYDCKCCLLKMFETDKTFLKIKDNSEQYISLLHLVS